MEDMVNPWQGRRVFLTGHTGFKGGWLALWLAAKGAQIRGYALDPSIGAESVSSGFGCRCARRRSRRHSGLPEA